MPTSSPRAHAPATAPVADPAAVTRTDADADTVRIARRDAARSHGAQLDTANAPPTAAPTTGDAPPDKPAAKASGGAGPGAPTGQPAGGKPGGKQVISLDEFLVEGKLEKPSAYFILRRSSADHDWARLDARFLPLVLESVQDPLF